MINKLFISEFFKKPIKKNWEKFDKNVICHIEH